MIFTCKIGHHNFKKLTYSTIKQRHIDMIKQFFSLYLQNAKMF